MTTAGRLVPGVGLALWALLGPAPAHAEEVAVWAWATPVSAERPVPVRIGLEQSPRFPHGTAPVKAARLDSNMVLSEGALAELKAWGPSGSALVSRTLPLPAGLHLFQFGLKAESLTIPAAAFNRHLVTHGLGAAGRERGRRKEEALPGHERRTRLGKALIDLGDAPGEARVLPETPVRGAGFSYDVVPTSPPHLWRTGQRVEVKVMHGDTPALDRAVSLTCVDRGRAATVRGRSNAYGIVPFEVPPGERCFLQSIDMARVDDDASWDSVWVTFTFTRRIMR